MNKLIIGILLVTLLFPLYNCGRRTEITTASPEALSLYRQAENLRYKLYFNDAKRHYWQALEIDPDFAMAYLRLAYIYQIAGPRDSAKYYLNLAKPLRNSVSNFERLLINHRLAYYNENYSLANTVMDSLVRLYPGAMESRLLLAYHKWQTFDYAGARKIFQDILKQYPNFVSVYNDIGYLYAKEGLFKEALTYLEKYKHYAPNQLNPYDSICEIYLAIGSYQEVIQILENLMQSRADEIDQKEYLGTSIHHRLARAYQRLGQYQKALEILAIADDKYRSHHAKISTAHNRFYLHRDLNQVDQMETVLSQLEAEVPGSEPLFLHSLLNIDKMKINAVLSNIRSLQTAIDTATTAEAKRATLSKKTLIEAELNFKIGLYDEAARQYDLAIQTINDTLNTIDIRVRKYISLGNGGDYNQAVTGLKQIIKMNPNYAPALVHLGQFLIKLDRNAEARSYLNHFYNLWQNADADVPLLEKAELVKQYLS